MFIAAQFDPTTQAINNPGQPGIITSNNLTPGGTFTIIVKNWSAFDITFFAADGNATFYVESRTARAFHLTLPNWKIFFTPVCLNGLFVSGRGLPNQQVTIEAYFDSETIVESYPQTLQAPVYPPLDWISRNSLVFMATSKHYTSPATGNLPLALFNPGSTTLKKVITILSVRFTTTAVSSGSASIDTRHISADPLYTTVANAICLEGGLGAAATLIVEHQNTSVTLAAGDAFVKVLVNNTSPFIELLAPAVLTLPSQSALGAATPGGFTFFFLPAVASDYAWTVLWKEELQ